MAGLQAKAYPTLRFGSRRGFGPRRVRAVLLLLFHSAAEEIYFAFRSGQRRLQATATVLQQRDLRLQARLFIFQLATASVSCLFRMRRAVTSGGTIDVFRFQSIIDLVHPR